MTATSDKSKETLAGYLRDNDWEKELNYKLWVTKGARFCAAQRLTDVSEASTKALTFLSAYLIIIGLVPTFLPAVSVRIPTELFGLSTVGISILVLVYSLLESSRQYSLRASRHHDCALRLGRLYDNLRRAKTLEPNDVKESELARITRKYERTLELYSNHEPIDYACFQLQKSDYFKISFTAACIVKMRAYYHSTLSYHLLIAFPPSIVAALYILLR